MIRTIVFVIGLCIAFSVTAQNQIITEDGIAAELRALDTLTGVVTDFTVQIGETQAYERLMVTVHACRYPQANPSSDAFVLLTIKDIREDQPRFDAWMIASSPALSALEHPRYDVWLLRCKISDG